MNTQELEKRVTDITKEAEQAFALYHKLLGHLSEAKYVLDQFKAYEAVLNKELEEADL